MDILNGRITRNAKTRSECQNSRNKGKRKIMGGGLNAEVEVDLQTMRISWHAVARDGNE